MKKPVGKQARVFQAFTIVKKGRLSKTHLTSSKDEMSDEDKRAQVESVKVVLIPVSEVRPEDVNNYQRGGEAEPAEEEEEANGNVLDPSEARDDDVDGNVL